MLWISKVLIISFFIFLHQQHFNRYKCCFKGYQLFRLKYHASIFDFNGPLARFIHLGNRDTPECDFFANSFYQIINRASIVLTHFFFMFWKTFTLLLLQIFFCKHTHILHSCNTLCYFFKDCSFILICLYTYILLLLCHFYLRFYIG